ncbi:MAG: DNA polymerase ligase N-terminal domain-containing protein [Nitrososphaerales archaeon]
MQYVITYHIAEKAGPHYDLYLADTDDSINFYAWALPKGLPTAKGVKHLAVKVADHPAEDVYYEGPITKGYGKGTKAVWDEGQYNTDSRIVASKPVKITFHGNRLKGSYYLLHWRGNQWLVWRAN